MPALTIATLFGKDCGTTQIPEFPAVAIENHEKSLEIFKGMKAETMIYES